MARQLAVLWAAVPLAAQSVLGCSATEAFHAYVVGENQEQVERHLRLENSGMRVYELILGLPNDWVRLTDRLKEVIG
jgi:hypothetical protein